MHAYTIVTEQTESPSTTAQKTVISASRRTDIPAYYLDWLIERVGAGYADVVHPFDRSRVRRVPLGPEDVHTIVFWSKNYAEFLKRRATFDRFRKLYFQFTVNDCELLEPRVPPLQSRLEQTKVLAERYGPERMAWRFDPIVFWNGGRENNLGSFERIASYMAGIGVNRCVFSFAKWYRKARRRAEKRGFPFFVPPEDRKRAVASDLAAKGAACGITMHVCCDDSLTDIENVQKSSCIDGPLLENLSGEPCDTRRDTGQRDMCGCTKSVDIGSYHLQPCPNGCLYCYASPVV